MAILGILLVALTMCIEALVLGTKQGGASLSALLLDFARAFELRLLTYVFQ